MEKRIELTTRKNYDFFEASSAFQKSIRRGEEKNALFFAHELYCSGYSGYVWKRILVMTSEDIGLANPQLASQIMSLYQMWEVIAKKNIEEASMPCIQAIVLLCRSEKSRMIDEYKIWLFKTDYAPEVPDYALDIHTRRGKIMGKTHKDFLEEGQKINNEVLTFTPPEVKEFYTRYLTDYANKKVQITGYDKRNVTHKTTKDMAQWKKENSQTNIFDNE